MTSFVYIAQSLDGFIADKDGNLDWLSDFPNPENSDFGFAEFMSKVDAVVMGRKTFEKVQTFGVWPYTKPVYVISASLNRLPQKYADKAEILNLKPSQIIDKLHGDGMRNLYIDGGALIQSFLAKDLIDELIITTLPVLLGAGTPLFGYLNNPLKFRHLRSEVLINSLLKSHYKRQN